MTTINKYSLEQDKTRPYLIEHIHWKGLSNEIIKNIDFKKGNFFTLLPEDAALERKYVFEGGWIIPPKLTGETRQRSDGSTFYVHQIQTMEFELCSFIQGFLHEDPESLVIVENTNAEITSKHFEIEDLQTVFYHQEVYYTIHKDTPFKAIQSAITKGCEVWHALIVCVRGLNSLSKYLEQRHLEEICKNLTYLVTTAYDGESYIFWEKDKGKE